MGDNSVSQEVAWNLSQAIIDEISLLLNSAMNNYIKYNFEGCFRNLKVIKMIVIANLKEDERTTFKEKEKVITPLLNGINLVDSGFHIDKKISYSIKNGKDLTEKLEEYGELLMDVLKKYGYLIPPKEDKRNLNK